MQKCPYCHGSIIANMYYDEKTGVVTHRRYHGIVKQAVNTRVCLDCGGIFVDKKDCEAIKSEMERELKGK